MRDIFGPTLLGLMLGIPFGFWQESVFAGLFMFQIAFVFDCVVGIVEKRND